jgi:predicted RNA-binding protein YlqC (UPF0109 family)
VERRIDEKGVLLELTVDPEDLGRVIGKRGATAQSLRTLLRALGTKNDARYNLKIVDNGEGPHYSAPAQKSRSDDDDAATTAAAPSSATNDDEDEMEETSDTVSSNSDRLARTRKELEELDDLDL